MKMRRILRTPVLAALVLALAALAPVATAHATSQTTSFSQTVTFDSVKVTISGTITVDSTAKTLSATVTVTAVNSTTGATIFSQTFSINLSFGTFSTPKFVLNIPSVPLTVAASCTFNVSTSCVVTRTPDLDHSGTIDFVDISTIAVAFGSRPGSPRWNPAADLDANGMVDFLDVSIAALDYGAPVY